MREGVAGNGSSVRVSRAPKLRAGDFAALQFRFGLLANLLVLPASITIGAPASGASDETETEAVTVMVMVMEQHQRYLSSNAGRLLTANESDAARLRASEAGQLPHSLARHQVNERITPCCQEDVHFPLAVRVDLADVLQQARERGRERRRDAAALEQPLRVDELVQQPR